MDVSYVNTTKAKLSTVPLKHGQVIFVLDPVSHENSIHADFLNTDRNIVERHLLTTLPNLTLSVDLSNGHLMYQYSVN